MANQSQHAGTIADPIPQRLLYKKGDKVYTVATGPSTSGPTTDVVEATDTRKGITKLSDSITSTSDAATGVTAATPLAVKSVNDKVIAAEEKNAEQDQRLTAIENKNLDTDKKLTGVEETLTDHAGRIDALENAGGGSTIVLVPRITSPAQNEVNVLTTFTITGSPYQTLLEGDKRKHRVFELSKSKTFDSLVWTKTVDADSAEVTPPVDQSTDFYIRIKDESQQGYSSPWSTVTKITSGGPTKVSNPTVSISGDAQAAKANPTFTGSEFAIEPSDQNDPSEHVSTTWTLRKIDGNLLVWQSTDDIINKTSLTLSVGTLNVSTKYKMEMQYTSKSHGSSAVATVEFTTAAEFTKVKTPTVSIEGGADTVYETPVIKGGAFATTVVEDVDTHKSSTWWITKKVGGAEVFRLDNSTDALTSVTVPKGKLEVSTQYVAHVIYTGTTYGASAEATLEFTTADEFKRVETPTIEIAGGTTATSTKPTFNGSSFAVIPNDPSVNHTSTTWWITRASGEEVHRTDKSQTALTVFTCPITLDSTQSYVVHAIYHTDTFGDSAEGSLEFTTRAANTGIRTPVIKIEDGTGTAEAYQIGTVFELDEAIDFAKPTEIVEFTDWDVYEGSSLISYQRDSKLWKFLSYIPAQLKPSTKYKVRVRQQISGYWSEYAEKYFTTADTLNYPPLRFKMKTKVNIQKILGDINPTEYDFFIDDAPSEDLKNKWNQDVTLSESGQWVKLVHTTKPWEYPRPTFCGTDNTLAGMLLEVDPLPYLGKVDLGGKGEHAGGGGGGSAGRGSNGNYGGEQGKNGNGRSTSTGQDEHYDGKDVYGCFANCTALTSLHRNLFKFNQFSNTFGGLGGNGGSGGGGGGGGSNNGGNGGNGSGNGGKGYGAFYNCTGLQSLPDDLFKYVTSLTHLGGLGGAGGSGGGGGGGSGNGTTGGGHGGGGYSGNGSGNGGEGAYIAGSGNGGNGGNGSGNGGDGYGCFYGCTSLTTLPNNLFRYNRYILDLGGVIIYIKDGGGGAGGGGTSYTPTVAGNGGKGGYGEGVSGNAYGCFCNCSGLQSLPSDLFKYSIKLVNVGAVINKYYENKFGCGGDGDFGGAGGAAGIIGGGGGGAGEGRSTHSGGHGGTGGGGGHGSISKAYGCFANCISLASLPTMLFNSCKNLTNIGVHGLEYSSSTNTAGGVSDGTAKGGAGGSGSTLSIGTSYGCFYNCSSLNDVPINLLQFIPTLKSVGTPKLGPRSSSLENPGTYTLQFPDEMCGAFSKCGKATVSLRLTAKEITAVENFAKETAARGTVYVPRGSTTATSFKNSPTANVNVIEEDMA